MGREAVLYFSVPLIRRKNFILVEGIMNGKYEVAMRFLKMNPSCWRESYKIL